MSQAKFRLYLFHPFFWDGLLLFWQEESFKEIPRSGPFTGVKSVKISAKSHILSRPLFFCHGHILEIVTATLKVSRATFCVNMSRANYIFHGQILAFFVTGTFGKSRALFPLLSRAFQKVSRGKKQTLCGVDGGWKIGRD